MARDYRRRSRSELIRLARKAGAGCLLVARRRLASAREFPSQSEHYLAQHRAALQHAREEFTEAARLALDSYFVLRFHRKERVS